MQMLSSHDLGYHGDVSEKLCFKEIGMAFKLRRV